LIDTRQELIYALYEATEIEHGLMIQYLFASFTMKKNIGEHITAHSKNYMQNDHDKAVCNNCPGFDVQFRPFFEE
jgi:hypothetical protein